jgi:hypothetical protein
VPSAGKNLNLILKGITFTDARTESRLADLKRNYISFLEKCTAY